MYSTVKIGTQSNNNGPISATKYLNLKPNTEFSNEVFKRVV